MVLQQALADLNTAYRNYFNSVSGKRKGWRVAPPRFRSRKDTRQAVRFTRNSRFTVLPNGRLRLPKVGDVPVRWSRVLPCEPSSVTVILDAAGRYFVSFVVQVDNTPLPPVDVETGIDLGLTHFAVLSDGRKIDNPRVPTGAQVRPEPVRAPRREAVTHPKPTGQTGIPAIRGREDVTRRTTTPAAW